MKSQGQTNAFFGALAFKNGVFSLMNDIQVKYCLNAVAFNWKWDSHTERPTDCLSRLFKIHVT